MALPTSLPRNFLLGFILFLAVALAACRPALLADPTPVTPAATVTPEPTASPEPSPTPTPNPPMALLVAPETGSTLAGEIEPALSNLAGQAGLRFERRTGLAAEELTPNLRIVVVLPPDPGLAALAASAPATQFLGIGISGLETAANLSLIGSQGPRPDQQAFLAGYIAALITADWRVGVISRADEPAGLAARQAFHNGAIYYCGLCRPAYPPFYQYPLFSELQAGASQADQQAAADALINQAVSTVYVAPGSGDDRLIEYLAQKQVNVIGTAPPAGVQNQWVASITADLSGAMAQLWPKLVDGEGGASLELPVSFSAPNETLFSLGRQRLAEEMQADLSGGFIDTGVDPVTGEPNR